MNKDLNKENFTELLEELQKDLNLKQSDIAKGINAHNITSSNVENRKIISIKTFF